MLKIKVTLLALVNFFLLHYDVDFLEIHALPDYCDPQPSDRSVHDGERRCDLHGDAGHGVPEDAVDPILTGCGEDDAQELHRDDRRVDQVDPLLEEDQLVHVDH